MAVSLATMRKRKVVDVVFALLQNSLSQSRASRENSARIQALDTILGSGLYRKVSTTLGDVSIRKMTGNLIVRGTCVHHGRCIGWEVQLTQPDGSKIRYKLNSNATEVPDPRSELKTGTDGIVATPATSPEVSVDQMFEVALKVVSEGK